LKPKQPSIEDVLLEFVRKQCEEDALRGSDSALLMLGKRMGIIRQSAGQIVAGNRGRKVSVRHLDNMRRFEKLNASAFLFKLGTLAIAMESSPARVDMVKLKGSFGASFVRSELGGAPASARTPSLSRVLKSSRKQRSQ
jgi:hypothetical protein